VSAERTTLPASEVANHIGERDNGWQRRDSVMHMMTGECISVSKV